VLCWPRALFLLRSFRYISPSRFGPVLVSVTLVWQAVYLFHSVRLTAVRRRNVVRAANCLPSAGAVQPANPARRTQIQRMASAGQFVPGAAGDFDRQVLPQLLHRSPCRIVVAQKYGRGRLAFGDRPIK
jgi:hypothetical protein